MCTKLENNNTLWVCSWTQIQAWQPFVSPRLCIMGNVVQLNPTDPPIWWVQINSTSFWAAGEYMDVEMAQCYS